jgi:hypothetical protein
MGPQKTKEAAKKTWKGAISASSLLRFFSFLSAKMIP